jgi:sulfate/thiosulfate-binding protein
VEFSLEPDMTRLVDAGLVDKSWNQNAHKGFVTDSVVVFVVRKGNPKHIKTWDDLIKGDTEVIEPNPFTSGGAKWNIMAAYGAQLEAGKSEAQAKDYLTKLFDHVPVLDKSAREALQTFTSGKGDVLLSYENEAILAQQKGEDVDYVVPDQTIKIENPVATVNESKHLDKAKAFVDYLYTPAAQKIFAAKGYRPVVNGVSPPAGIDFPTPPQLFEISKFGGWSSVNDQFFDPEKGIVAQIFQSQGKSTASG